jgi:radical SAM protein with 4Fe4S-binding SPASM domain
VITVSLDGDEQLNDEVRGIKGGFQRQIATFNALRRMPGISAALGVTLSRHNVGSFARTFEACAQVCPDLRIDEVHLNVAQVSGHYYGNDEDVSGDRTAIRQELQAYRRRRGVARTPHQILERAYLTRLDRFLQTGQTPMPCHALRSSCFIDPWGVVYPCISYSRPIGRLRETGMRLDPIWNARATQQVQQEIWQGQCPQCWTACEAYQSILGNVLAGRTLSRAPAPPTVPADSGATVDPVR